MNKAIFLDRDGTINIEKNYLYKPEDFEYVEGAVEGLKKLADSGYLLVIVTNQSGIARGYYSEEEYKELERWMLADLRAKGIEIAGVYYCPHYPEGIVPKYSIKCDCRKPGTELFWRAQKDLDIDMDSSYAIGDRLRDLAICEESGVNGILLDKDKERGEEASKGSIVVCKSWRDICKYIA